MTKYRHIGYRHLWGISLSLSLYTFGPLVGFAAARRLDFTLHEGNTACASVERDWWQVKVAIRYVLCFVTWCGDVA
eukprot:2037686-Amphidinium_carterae.2